MELEDLKSDKEIKSMSIDDLKKYAIEVSDFGRDVLVDGNAFLHYALNKQLKDLSRQMADIKIDITSKEDNDIFDNIIKLAIQADKISEGLEKIKGRINNDQFDHIKEAKENTLEWAIQQAKLKKDGAKG